MQLAPILAILAVALGQPFVPNDPLFNDPTFGGQWYLANSAGMPHINVVPVWNQGITGNGVVIGFVDDGIEYTHPDLAPNYAPAWSYDFGDRDPDPFPVYPNAPGTFDGENHGTSVVGIAAARGGNGIGITGVAPHATVAMHRIDYLFSPAIDFVDATLYLATGSDPIIDIKNHSYGYRTPFLQTTAQVNALRASTAAGVIHVFAAANERLNAGADANKRQLQASPDAITVAAVGSDGQFAHYSSFGANVIVTAPSSTSGGLRVTTTDRQGNEGYNPNFPLPDYDDLGYTAVFGGTSASTPLVSGALALAKEVNPLLDTRLAKHLLVRSSQPIDLGDSSPTSDGGWRSNGAGHWFNPNYGFGLLDTEALVEMADLFGVSDRTTSSVLLQLLEQPIPDLGEALVTFDLAGDQPLEDLVVRLVLSADRRGDLSAYLTSPSGFTSRLFLGTPLDTVAAEFLSWEFGSVAFWGEDINGTWQLRVNDTIAGGGPSTLHAYSVTAYLGQLIPVPEPSTLHLALLILLFAPLATRRARQIKESNA